MYNNLNTQILTMVQLETRQVIGCLGNCMVLLCIILDVRSCVTFIDLQMQGSTGTGCLLCCREAVNPGLLNFSGSCVGAETELRKVAIQEQDLHLIQLSSCSWQ